MTSSPAAIAGELEARLRSAGTPERARAEKAYLRSDLEFLGVTVWDIRRAVRALALPDMHHDALLALVRALWSNTIFDRRMAAVLLLEAKARLLGPADLPLLAQLARESRTWALVDVLSGDVAAAIAAADPLATRPALDAWATDPDFWVRRSALLAMRGPLSRDLPGAFEQFAGYADRMLDEKDFFIRKAIGWVLREVGKRHPDQVVAWLEPRTHRASGVTMREAVKYLDASDRERCLEAYRAVRFT